MRRKTFKNFALRLVLIFMGSAFALGISEIALRIMVPDYLAYAGIERNFFCKFDPELGWSPLPDVTAQHLQNGFSTFVHQNQYGLRGSDSDSKTKNSSNHRVLVLGDSYAWGYGVNQNEMFTNPQIHKSSQDLLNFGVSGYGTDQEYLFYLRNGLEFDVDEVVLVFTPYNDVISNLEEKQYGYLKPYFKIIEGELVLFQDHIHDMIGRNLINQIRFHSRLVNTIERAYRTYRNSQKYRKNINDTSVARKRVFKEIKLSERDEEGIEITAKIIAALQKSVQRHGASFSVIFIPYKPHIIKKKDKNHPLVEKLSRELEKYAIDYYEPYYMFLNQEKTGIQL